METALVVVLVSVLIVSVIVYFGRNIKEANITALRSELSALRSTISLFQMTQGRCPGQLGEIFAADYALPYREGFFNKEFLKLYSLDEEGRVVDPFGRPYLFDPENCQLSSASPGFERY